VLYALVVFAPTGRPELQEQRVEIQRQANALFSLVSDEEVSPKPSPRGTTSATQTASHLPAPKPSAPNQTKEVDLVAALDSLADPRRAGSSLPFDPSAYLYSVCSMMWDWHRADPSLTTGSRQTEGAVPVSIEEARMEREVQRLASDLQSQQFGDFLSLTRHLSSIKRNADPWRGSGSSVTLNRDLDAVEDLLLNRTWRMRDVQSLLRFPLPMTPDPWKLSMSPFFVKANLAVLRALLRRDQDKVARLLVREMELRRILLLARFPYGSSYILERVTASEGALLMAAEKGCFPPEVYARVRRILDQAVLDPARCGTLRKAFALKVDEAIGDKTFWEMRSGGSPPKVFLRSMLFTSLGPAARFAALRLNARWGNGEDVAHDRRAWEFVGRAMGLPDYPANPLIDTTVYEAAKPENFNRDIHLTRLVAATAAFRNDLGRYPDSVRDLVPEYLDRAFVESPEINWRLCRMPRDSRPLRGERDPKVANEFLNSGDRPVFFHCALSYRGVALDVGLPVPPCFEERIAPFLDLRVRHSEMRK
jgi:hypothetical protein